MRHPVLVSILAAAFATPATAAPGTPAPANHVAAWDHAWGALRACLVGAPQLARDPGDAYTMSELGRGHHDCAAALAAAEQVARDGVADTGLRATWKPVADKLDRLGQDGYVHVTESMLPLSARNGGQTLEQAVGREITAIDEASTALHAAAHAAAIAIARPADDVPRLELTPRDIPGGDPWLAHPHLVRDHQLEADIETRDEHEVAVAIRGPEAIDVLGDPYLIGHRTATWGAAANDHEQAVRAGALDADGNVVAGAPVVMRGKGLLVAGVLERGDDRAVVVLAYGNDNHGPAWIVRSHDGGAHWAKPEKLAGGKRVGFPVPILPPPGVFLYWEEGGVAGSSWQTVTGGGDVSPVGHVAAELDYGDVCISGGVLWADDAKPAGLHISDGTGEHVVAPIGGTIVSCSAERVAYESSDGLRVCDRDGCGAAVKSDDSYFDLDAHGGVVRAAQVGSIVRVTTASGERFFHVEAKLFGVLSWDDHAYVAFTAGGGVAVAAVP